MGISLAMGLSQITQRVTDFKSAESLPIFLDFRLWPAEGDVRRPPHVSLGA